MPCLKVRKKCVSFLLCFGTKGSHKLSSVDYNVDDAAFSLKKVWAKVNPSTVVNYCAVSTYSFPRHVSINLGSYC